MVLLVAIKSRGTLSVEKSVPIEAHGTNTEGMSSCAEIIN